jgi:hypothetical protein
VNPRRTTHIYPTQFDGDCVLNPDYDSAQSSAAAMVRPVMDCRPLERQLRGPLRYSNASAAVGSKCNLRLTLVGRVQRAN